MTVSDPISSATMLQQRVLKKLKLGFEFKDETQWRSFLSSGYRAALHEFLNSTTACSLIFYLQGTELCASVKPGAHPPGRCVFFLKPTPEFLTPENFDGIVASGESAGDTLPCISSILDPNKTSGSIDDVLTSLPLPAIDFSFLETKIEEGEDGGIHLDRSTLIQLESAVSTWLSIVDISLSRPNNVAEKKEIVLSAKQGESNHLLSSSAVAAALSWEIRAADLESLNKQLQHRSITMVTQTLLKTDSSVVPSFLRSCYNVSAAAEEARAIAIALEPLLPLFERLYSSENLINASDAITMCMHGIFLAWQHCDALRSSSIAIPYLVRAMANDVVDVAQRCVYGAELLQDDLNEASNISRSMLRMLGHMKSCYADARDKASTLATHGEDSISFPTTPRTFRAIDALMARCQDIHTVCKTSNQYSKLEKIELGGPEGGAFTATARHLYSEFANIQEKMISQGSGTVDPFDLTHSIFPTAILGWKNGIKQLDARLSVFITRVLEAAPTFDVCCRIIESLEALCDRPIARRCIERVHLKAIKTYVHEMRAVEEIFECEKAAPPVALGAPPCAGAVAWVRGLQERLSVPMARFRNLNQSILQSKTGREMMRVYESVLRTLRSHEDSVMAAWCETSAGISDSTMKQPVLLQTLISPLNNSDTLHFTQTSTVQVNFDPALSLLLKEVRALTAMPGLSRPIPAAALALFQQEFALTQHISALKQLAAELNAVRSSLLAVEGPLVASALTAAENIAEKGHREVTWASKELDSFCSNASQCAIEISQQVKVLREVVDATEADIQQWQKDFPLSFSATDSANNMNSFASLKASAVGGASYTTTNSLKSFVNLNTWLETAAMHRSRAVDEGSKKLSTRLATAAEDLGLVPTSPSWVEYSRYVSTIAQKGCFDAVIVSLEALATLLVVEQGENGFSMPPLLTVALHVASGTEGLQWSPQLGSWRNEKNSAPGKGLPNTIAEMLEKYVFALLRLCSSLLPGHQIELEETSAVENALAAVRTAFDTSVARCKSAASQIFTFQHEIASTCAAAAAILSNSTSGEDGVLEKQVLDKIETEIHRLRALQDSIHQIPSLQTPLGWISMDFEPAKQALATAAGKHVALLTAKIKDHVQKELDSTMDYISKALDTIQSASIIVQVKERRPTIRGSSLEASRRATTMVAPTAGQRSSLMGRASTFSSFSKLSSRTSVVSDAGSTGSRRTSTAAPTAASVAVDPQQLYSLLRCFKEVNHRVSNSDAELGPLLAASSMLQRCGAPLSEEAESILRECPQAWRSLTRKASAAKEALSPVITAEIADVKNLHSQFNREVGEFRIHFQKAAPFGLPSGRELTAAAVEQAIAALDKLQLGTSSGSDVSINLHDFNSRSDSLQERRELLDIASSSQPGSCSSAATSFVDNTVSSSSGLKRCQEEADSLRLLWDEISTTLDIFSSWDALPWPQVDAEALGEECKRKNKDLKSLPRSVREYDSYKILESKVKGISTVLPLIKDLAHPAMKDRHWAALGRALNASLPSDPASLTLGALLDLRLDRCADACAEVVDTAKKEAVVEKALTKIESGWEVLTLGFTTIANAPPTTPPCLVVDETVIEALESDGVTLQNLSASKAVSGNPTFRSQVATWQKKLSNVDVVLSVWNDTQRKWTALEAIFCASADIRAQLPEEAALFDQVNSDFKELMMAAPATPAVLDACAVPGRRERLEMLLRSLELRERALQDYLETKRQAFPRFYFVSTADLLDILAKGGDPHSVEHHLPKLFDNLHRLEWKKDENTGQRTHIAIGMYSGEGEYVKFDGECNCTGAVEVWLAAVVDAMRAALRAEYRAAMPAYEEKPRSKWIFDYSAQTTILVSRTYFTQQVNDAFAELEGGNEDALKNLLERQKAQLSEIINLINGPLSKNDRKKLITLCTIDVHARDVVQRLIEDRCEAADVFAWQSQLRYIQDPKTGDPLVQICDADIPYQFEYIGNCGCLCITPLTDRCYITLTQAQRLILGGAPAGPAGTGKTETTKDLARALGVQCYVFNCSDQMDYKAMGQIYKGLAQTGAWGCFDEFNRIPVPVLSVCSTQYKAVLDALRSRQNNLLFEGTEIKLKNSAMAHITMNPGYIGRAELPESLKALFRPVSMAAPDLSLICEIMLMAEGFQAARALSKKFIALYRLCEDLLSKARHYDWKLRAIKTTLYVAGGMKRAAPELSEEKVLLRALRDFNLGKLTADDAAVFSGLLEDLFPKTSSLVPRAIDITFETRVKEAALELGYQPDPVFLLKVSQLREIFEVRWSVFLLGPPGCGKTAVWKTLQRALQLSGHKAVAKVINPKSVTRDELYGCLHPQTREWKEGLLSATYRSMAAAHNTNAASDTSASSGHHQWIVLDGDIDPEWIESMNTVMDDNKMLTLASNERIALAPSMRLLLEISHMNHASPATVSRGGVIYMNAEDVGWRASADSWLAGRSSAELRTILTPLFDRYVEPTLEFVRKKCATVVPLPFVNQVETLCKLVEGLLQEETQAASTPTTTASSNLDRKSVESLFVFASIWALGGCLTVDKVADHRAAFSAWWISEHKAVPIPVDVDCTVFDYFIDPQTNAWSHWKALLPNFDFAAAVAAASCGNPGGDASTSGAPLDPAAIFVPTIETIRMQYLVKLLLKNGHNAMLVGGAGTGKTSTIKDLLKSLDSESYATHTLPLNSFHDGPTLQTALEAPLERKIGTRYGPPGTKKLIYFIDDANMPSKDKYDTQSALELLRQAIDSKGWYDKAKATSKDVSGVQFVATMNPTSGSFTLSGRLQRHFATFFVPAPAPETAVSIFMELLQGHFASTIGGNWSEEMKKIASVLAEATDELHRAIVNTLTPSAVRFHYVFTLREVAAVVGGLLRMAPAAFCAGGGSVSSNNGRSRGGRNSDSTATAAQLLKVARLWSHECERVYADRLTSDGDLVTFEQLKASVIRRYFVPLGIKATAIDARPLLFSTFCSSHNGGNGADGGGAGSDSHAATGDMNPPFSIVDGDDNAPYDEIVSQDHLRRVLQLRLAEHNESNPAVAMDLVLFPQAAEHVVRIARVLDVPGGHVAMIGVGGSGKQSLARLAAYVAGCEVFQVQVTAGYGVNELKTDLATLYQKCGAKSVKIAFIITDAHIVDERFLVYINELLATGQVADLIPSEEREALGAVVRAEVKASGGLDTPEACWEHLLKKLRRNLHVVLCLSPAGERLRGLARRFPALVGCVTYNWLRPWPRDALESVAERFLITEPTLSGENNAGLRAAVAAYMASTHAAVEIACKQYLEQFRRYNYATPKSFLELIGVYKGTLQMTSTNLLASRERLEQGVDKISTAAAAVEGLRTALAAEKLVVAEKKAAAAALIESIGREKAIADEAVAASKGDEEEAATLTAQVLQVQTECTTDLAAAEPVIAAAEAALNSLDKASLGELKSFSKPAPEVVAVVAACMILTAPGGVIPKDLSWAGGKKWMGAQSLDAFLKSLTNFNKDNVPENCVERVEKDYLSQPNFKAEAIKVKSMAAAGLCAWVTNIAKYFRIYQVVAPKRAALAEANKKLADANRKLAGIRARITELRARVGALEASLVAATAEKVAAEAQAERTATKAALADRVIGGLGSEFQRWNAAIQTIKRKEETIIGDALLAAAFVSYAGAFNAQIRAQLVEGSWIPEAQRRGIPLSENPSPMNILCTTTSQASWAKEGLPGDRLSAENAGIVGATRRWPLLIDPQLHGARWVQGREGSKGLVILQQGTPKLLDSVIRCVENGTPLMIENLPEALEPALEPLVARRTVKRGRSVVLTLGGREVALHPEFKLYLHTKLPNPHYGPEVAAQTTMVNFAVTPEGLEEQLLAAVVGHEAADLQAQAAALAAQLAEYTVTLEELEDGLLARLAASQGDILEDKPLVESLEATKATALEVADNVAKAKTAEIKLNAACEVYRPVAARGAMLYFFTDSLSALNRVYWYSMANFLRVMKRGMDAATPLVPSKNTTTGEEERRGSQAPLDLDTRVSALISSVTEVIFTYVTQGLFEQHKPVAAAQLALATLKARSALTPAALDFLLRAPQASGKGKVAVEWLSSPIKATVLALEEVEGFRGLFEDLESSAKRWAEWYHLDRPEEEPLPGDWKKLTALHKLLVVRAMRPDRLGPALSSFVAATLGPAFTASKNFDLELALQDAGPATPVLIFVSPGVDAAASVEAAAKKKGLIAAGKYASVSLGQGQEAPAMAKLRHAASHGGWVLLQNIHLTMEWTWVELDGAIDSLSATTGTAHPDFQLFLSAEPPPSLERPLPPSLLQSCIKLTNEPPQGIRANLARAWAIFDDDALDLCARQTEYRAILFALCFFHAVLQERKKYGVGNSPDARSGIGWNMAYPFSAGDLRCCGQLAANYIDSGAKIPWDDLRYLAGEIIYGGHVVELWDRRLVGAYLESLLSPALLETGRVCPQLSLPPAGLNHAQTTQYILEKAPIDGAGPLGLHSNAERGVALRAAGEICAALAALQSGGGAAAAATGGGATVEERCKSAMEAIIESLPSAISIEDVRTAAIAPSATTDQGQPQNLPGQPTSSAPGPFAMVVLQECERMNIVLSTIRTSLDELALGLKGDLVISESMDALATALAADRVPLSWAAVAYPSLRPLSSWIKNLISRHIQLSEWSSSPNSLPNSVWLPGLFNPASFLTAVQQVAARKGGYALDATALVTEVTRKVDSQVDAPPREGAYIHGLYLEGARWEERNGCLEESRPKEMACALPVLHVRGVPAEKVSVPADTYACPVYTTEARFRQEVFTVQLKGGKQLARKWAQAGVALLLDVA